MYMTGSFHAYSGCNQWRNEGGQGRKLPRRRLTMGTPNHCGWRRMTTVGAEKSQQCHKHFLQYSTFASERPHFRIWGRQTFFLPRAPANLVTPLEATQISIPVVIHHCSESRMRLPSTLCALFKSLSIKPLRLCVTDFVLLFCYKTKRINWLVFKVLVRLSNKVVSLDLAPFIEKVENHCSYYYAEDVWRDCGAWRCLCIAMMHIWSHCCTLNSWSSSDKLWKPIETA